MENDNELDLKKLRYVLYARKSTTSEERQIRSVKDQIFECENLARYLHLNVVDVFEEHKSAKKPHQRPIFTQILSDIRKRKYDAIIAWNPDRLARNMLEGGTIIDMIDNEIIKDLKFVTHHFTKDANGKMLLGMAFVLSKQYSDDLSQKVTRGVRRSFSEGKTPTPKHGYYRDENGLYQPDGKNYDLIKKAWEIRKEGTSLEEIAEFLNTSDYGRKTKSGRVITMKKQMLTDLFRDPFYYGILVQVNDSIDLRNIYDLQTMITEEDYISVQELTNRRIKPYKQKSFNFLPFKAMIICSYCENYMYPGASKSHSGKRYLFYRCDKKYCSRSKKSIRAKNILAFIYSFLEEGLNFTEAEYSRYYSKMTKLSDDNREKIRKQKHSLEGSLKSVKKEIKDIALGLLKKEISDTVKKINNERILELESNQEFLEREIAKLRVKITDPEKDRLSLEQFLNLSKNAAVIVKSADALLKDKICRNIFLNLKVDEEKVLSYQTKEPFATLLKQRDKSSSRGEATLLEPLVESIITHWDIENYIATMRLRDMKSRNVVYNMLYEY